ncbi:PEP-CTERM/exosortase system-associated acyltransferase [Alteromonas gracilis]|uniref:PEP-CTERM/exosortase system-associated acyltransferase n=1 Tax=Alteromonas gracilis TaxID=1479524 RepID=UPI00373533F9
MDQRLVAKKTIIGRVKSIVGRDSKLGKALGGLEKLQEAKFISKHFSEFLEPVVAQSPTSRQQSYNIRHKVYCEELGFEPLRDNSLETDEFDTFSSPCLIKHKSSGHYAGTVRLVRPQVEGQQLPIEKYCLNSITHETLNPSKFARKDICEISRLAVPLEFRKRQMDRFAGAATGVINEHTYSENELRCFPFIAIGLYFSAAALVMHNEIKHTYVMMEPRLARSMRFVGIQFEQVGPVIDYHGKRAPYYINPSLLYANLRPSFKLMLKNIQQQVEKYPRD